VHCVRGKRKDNKRRRGELEGEGKKPVMERRIVLRTESRSFGGKDGAVWIKKGKCSISGERAKKNPAIRYQTRL